MCSSLGVLVFLLCCSLNLVAKDQHLVYDGESYIYELTFDDGRISDDTMRDIWWLSPWVGEPPQGPFGIAGSVWISPQGETLVDKVFYAPWLELCFEKPGVNCDRNPEVLDKAFLENASRNLRIGDEQVERLRKEELPSILEPVRVYLLLHLNSSLEREKARYAYLKSGDLKPMQHVLCSERACSDTENKLLKQLEREIDGTHKIKLSRTWINQALEGERKIHPPAYPIEVWKHFLKEFGVNENRQLKQID